MKSKTTLVRELGISVLAFLLYSSGAQGQEVGINRPGKDLKTGHELASADPALCKKDCDTDPNCKAYTYVNPNIQGPKPRCWLKIEVPPVEKNDCCTSGFKGEEVVTNRPGNDLKPGYALTSADPALCKKDCDTDPNCKAYTYVNPNIQGPKPRCWLKSGVPTAVKDDCCTSGVKEHVQYCYSFAPVDLQIRERAEHWMIINKKDGVTLLDFGSSMSQDGPQNFDLALKILKTLQQSEAMEQCYIGDSSIHYYYLVGNQASTVKYAYCQPDYALNAAHFDPHQVKGYEVGNVVLLVDDKNIILPFAKGTNAYIASEIIHNYGFNLLCYNGPQFSPRIALFFKLP